MEILSKRTLLERIGGKEALKSVVNGFYARLVTDPKLAPFFEGVNMKFLKEHQEAFLAIAFTGVPAGLDVPQLIMDKHRALFAVGLDETHFDLVAGHLVKQLQDMGVAQKLIDEVVEIVGPLRAVFVAGAEERRMYETRRRPLLVIAGVAAAGVALAALVALRRRA